MSWVQEVSNWVLGSYRVRTTKLSDNSLVQHVAVVDINGSSTTKGRQRTAFTSDATEKTIITAGGSGVYRDPYLITLNNKSATAVTVTIREATAGSTVWDFTVPAGGSNGFALPKESAVPQSAANQNWTAQCSSSVDSVYITAGYVERS